MNWQIRTLPKPTKFSGLGNFGTREINNLTPVLVNEKGEILAIPGVIGGMSSKSENNSLGLILEVPNFDAEMVSRSAAQTNYRSDGSRIWSGQVKKPLQKLFQIHLCEILNLWQIETQKKYLENPKISAKNSENEIEIGNLENYFEKSEKKRSETLSPNSDKENVEMRDKNGEIMDLKSENSVLENENLISQNTKNNSQNQTSDTISDQDLDSKNSENSENSTKFSTKLWQIKPILKWEKPEKSENVDILTKNLKQSLTKEVDTLESIEILENLELESLEITKNNSQNGLKVDFEYLASRLDGQSVEFWQPILIQKMNLVGFFDAWNNLWFGNIFYGNIDTLEQLLIELMRLIGFEKLQTQHLNFTNNSQNQKLAEFKLKQNIKKLAVKSGFTEVITRPFVNEKSTSLCSEKTEKVLNPYSSFLPFLRNSLLVSLLQIVSENLTRGWKNPMIMEQNQIFQNSKPKEILAMIAVQNNPYSLTTFIHELTQKLGFDETLTTFEKLENSQENSKNIGQTIIYALQKNSNSQSSQKPGKTKIEQNKTEIENTEIKNGKIAKNSSNSGKLVQNPQIKLVQISNAVKKEFGIPLLKAVWYLEFEIDQNWHFETLSRYFDESELPSVVRDYSLQTAQNWQQIVKKVTKIPRDFDLRIWPVDYFLETEKTEKLQTENSKSTSGENSNENSQFQMESKGLGKTKKNIENPKNSLLVNLKKSQEKISEKFQSSEKFPKNLIKQISQTSNLNFEPKIMEMRKESADSDSNKNPENSSSNNEFNLNFENSLAKQAKISFRVKLQSKKQTLTKDQIEFWESQMLQSLK